jgi:hypothetical protein
MINVATALKNKNYQVKNYRPNFDPEYCILAPESENQ